MMWAATHLGDVNIDVSDIDIGAQVLLIQVF